MRAMYFKMIFTNTLITKLWYINNKTDFVHSHACAKVGQLEMTLSIQQHVVGLYISTQSTVYALLHCCN